MRKEETDVVGDSPRSKAAYVGTITRWHFTDDERELMRNDAACDKEIFDAETRSVPEPERLSEELTWQIGAEPLRRAGLSHLHGEVRAPGDVACTLLAGSWNKTITFSETCV